MIKVRQRIEFVDSAIGVMENYPKGKEKEIDGLIYVSTGDLWEPQNTVIFASYPAMGFVLKSVQNFKEKNPERYEEFLNTSTQEEYDLFIEELEKGENPTHKLFSQP
mgnify:FL=1